MTKLSGLIAATFTPIDDEGNLNLGNSPACETALCNGLHGAFIQWLDG